MTNDEILYKKGWTMKAGGFTGPGTTYEKNGVRFDSSLDAMRYEGENPQDVVESTRVWEPVVTIERCINCGSSTSNSWVRQTVSLPDYKSPVLATVQCGDCATVKRDYPRDAEGQRVKLPSDFSPHFSYATGENITSSRQYAESLKRQNLVQKEAY